MRRRSAQLSVTSIVDFGPPYEGCDATDSDLNIVSRVERIIGRVGFPDWYPWKPKLAARACSEGSADLVCEYFAPDRTTGERRKVRYERSRAVTDLHTDQEILHIILTNLAVVAVHEMLEHFTLDGKRRFDPHTTSRLLDTRYAELLMLTPTGSVDKAIARRIREIR